MTTRHETHVDTFSHVLHRFPEYRDIYQFEHIFLIFIIRANSKRCVELNVFVELWRLRESLKRDESSLHTIRVSHTAADFDNELCNAAYRIVSPGAFRSAFQAVRCAQDKTEDQQRRGVLANT